MFKFHEKSLIAPSAARSNAWSSQSSHQTFGQRPKLSFKDPEPNEIPLFSIEMFPINKNLYKNTSHQKTKIFNWNQKFPIEDKIFCFFFENLVFW